MSSRSSIFRYSLVLNKLRTKPYSSYEEIENYVENELEFKRSMDDALEMGFSKRTMQRDLRELRSTWGIDIEYSRTRKGYYIEESEAESQSFNRIIEAFDVFNSLNISRDLAAYVYVEKREPQGTKNLYGLIHAIKNRLRSRFIYQKFWEEERSERTVEPYALKEFRDRWYVIAKDKKDDKIKTFGLDRLSELEISGGKFQRPKDFNIREKYKNYSGIITPEELRPVAVILSFDPVQGKYIKTLPLHESQEVLIDTENEVKVKLTICLTEDFIMELLSFGNRVKVIKPLGLVKRISSTHYEAYKLYK